MYSNITTSDLKSLIGQINIIDIRDNYLFRLGNIPTAKNIPNNFLLTNPDNYLEKEETYYIYCAQGITSTKSCTALSNKGYKVINVLGGYNDYINRI